MDVMSEAAEKMSTLVVSESPSPLNPGIWLMEGSGTEADVDS